MALVIGIDPGTGVSSDTGFSVFDTDSGTILYASNIGTSKRVLHHRIKEISDVLDLTLQDILKNHPDKQIVVCIESFVMRGKGGESLQRLIGSFLGRLPFQWELREVPNTVVKLILAGHGHADKVSVGIGLIDAFTGNEKSQKFIKDLIKQEDFDIIDSLAIGVAGWTESVNQVKSQKKSKKSTRAQ